MNSLIPMVRRYYLFLIIFNLANSLLAQNNLLKKVYKVNDDSLLYNILIPADSVNKTKNIGELLNSKKYPLIIFLHGAGERGSDNEKQTLHIRDLFLKIENQVKYPAFVVAPQCPAEEKWVNIAWADTVHIMPEKISKSLGLTIKLIDNLTQGYPIDTNRIYVMGLSMGGYGTWDMICRFPEKFAAAIPVCGGGDIKKAKLLKDTPIWAFHGSIDKVVPVKNSRSMIKAIQIAGGNPKYTEYSKVGHDSWIKAFKENELLNWLFNQKK